METLEKPETESGNADLVVEPQTEQQEPDADSTLVGIEGAEELLEATEEMAESFEVEDYTAHGTNLNHGHDRDKHNAISAFNLNPEFVSDYFVFDPADHAAPHELLARKQEFVNADEDLFTDVSDTNSTRWKDIKSKANSAPIPDKAHRRIDSIASKQA